MAGEEGLFAGGFFIGMGVALLLIIVLALALGRKSRNYRKELADLYVAGRIKQLAKEDSIDLVEENESFKKWCKKQNIGYQDLDVTILEDLQEKITEKSKKLSK